MNKKAHLETLERIAELQRLEKLRSEAGLRTLQAELDKAEAAFSDAEQSHEGRQTEYDKVLSAGALSITRIQLATMLLQGTERDLEQAKADCVDSRETLRKMTGEHLVMQRHGELWNRNLNRAKRRVREDKDQAQADEACAALLYKGAVE